MTVQLDVTALTEPYEEGLRAADEMVLIGGAADGVAGTTVLVAEDGGNGRGALQHYLRRIGYNVGEMAGDGSLLDSVFAHPADLVVIDLDENGGTAEVLSEIRDSSSVPIIVCSSRATERERVNLLNLGADDLLTKPFSFAELEARMRAVLRRGNSTPSMKLEYGDLVIDEGTRTVTVESVDVPMTRKEFDLLAFLASAPGRVFSRDDLLERVWGSNGRWQGRSTVTEHIRRVRLKIEEDPENPRWITTIRGVGYRFATPMA
jgi:two-component system alkaline phosphatase synthesis response regulator PhoP